MSWTLQDIQNQIASEIDLSATAPTTGGADWSLRLNAINRSLRDWADSYEWRSLHKVFNGVISTSTGNASYALPTDFRKLDGFPRVAISGTNYDLPAVNPSDNRKYTSSDKFVNVLGNETSGYVMYISADTLPSGASVSFTYYASPATLSSATQVAEIPDPTFLVQKSLYYILKAQEDGRFPEAKSESDRILARMIENENTLGKAYVDRNIQAGGEKNYGFRIGRD